MQTLYKTLVNDSLCLNTVIPEPSSSLNAVAYPGCNVTFGGGHSATQPAHKPNMGVQLPTHARFTSTPLVRGWISLAFSERLIWGLKQSLGANINLNVRRIAWYIFDYSTVFLCSTMVSTLSTHIRFKKEHVFQFSSKVYATFMDIHKPECIS